MSLTIQKEDVLTEALETIDQLAVRGELSPAAVISVIDNICMDAQLRTGELPQELATLRGQAKERRDNGDVGFREDYVADLIVMCGLWAI